MTGISLGPIVLSVDRFAFIAGVTAFLVLVALIRRFGQPPATLDAWATRLLVLGLVGGRLGYVALHLDIYAQAPLSVLAIWQGGFNAAAGFSAVAVGLGWMALRKQGHAAGVLLGAVMAAALVWQGSLMAFPAPRLDLPDVTFAALDGPDVALGQSQGRPVVINLWATWCPPCRRELPMMMELAENTPDVDVIFLNQGEFGPAIRAYLHDEGLSTDRVALDPEATAMALFDTPGLPATLFFSSSGQMESVHLGEISRAAFRSQLQALR